MFTENEIIEIINRKIESDEKLGSRSGGSGHMGHVSYKLSEFKSRQLSTDLLEISYKYIVFVETEFTYYPDNPPMEYPRKKTITVNRKKEIVTGQ